MKLKKPLETYYGKWTVIGAVVRADKPGGGRGYKVRCRCVCRREFDVSVGDLRSGKSKCCRYCAGKVARPSMQRPPKPKPLYGEWEPLGPLQWRRSSSGRFRWWVQCRCSCGRVRWLFWTSLANGQTASCGHRYRFTKEQKRIARIYHSMIRRCHDERTRNFGMYGGRGIFVCDEWRNDIWVFIRWAEANGIKAGLHLDRRENDGPYSPENCRFVTPKQNARNTRRTIYVTAFGETKPLPAWAEDPRCEVSAGNLRTRIVVQRLPPELAITLPPKAGMPLEYRAKFTVPRHFG